MRIITIEEHIPSPKLAQAVQRYSSGEAPYMQFAGGRDLPYSPDPALYADIGEKRLADMDQGGVDMQVLSVAGQPQYLPPEEATPIVREVNDEMAAAIAMHPDRFSGFAALPWSDPENAAKELERCVTALGLKGALLSGRPGGAAGFLEDARYTPILETAQALNVPIYVHPGPPMKQIQEGYYAGLGDVLSARLSLYGWGWHHEAGIQVLRMILSGAFEKFPKLRLIAGHWGEMVPFFLSRLDQALPQSVTKLNRSITDTFRQNIYVTPSGIFDYPQLKFCIEVLGADRIIHSVDFPFIGNEGALHFVENAPITQEEKEMIAYGNAEKLLKL